MTNESFDAETFPDLLPIYYQRLFPFSLYYKWLNYETKLNSAKNPSFPNREFSFTLRDDVYLRYQSFKDDAEMKKMVLEKVPYKMDIGAVYSMKPREHRMSSSFHALEKELVFDIDMTDYDDVRTCCSGADICEKCWMFMTVALKILDRALREDFGFRHLLWVYSGRRGIHCWVCDEVARKLSPRARAAIVEYLSLLKGGEYKSKKVHLSDVLHPSIKEAAEIVEKYFPTLMLENQKILESEKGCEKVVRLCQDENVRNLAKNSLNEKKSSAEKWETLREIDDTATQKVKNKNMHFLLEVMFEMCYPRLDVNVSKGLNHLLKAPFCVHPKTGRVCVPIDPRNADDFNPMTVPTINQLCDEINAYDAQNMPNTDGSDQNSQNQRKKVDDAMKTSLKRGIRIFESFVENLCSES